MRRGQSVQEAAIGDAFSTRVVLRRIARALAVLLIVIVIGTLGYVVLEGWTFLDALYMTMITIGSAGFEEVRDLRRGVPGHAHAS